MDLQDRLQSTLGNTYSVERELGGGGMSRVFLAEEISLGRKVVAKAVVTDFEIAKAISAARTSGAAPEENTETESGFTLTQAGVSVGTPAYMSPEQVAGDSVDHRADIYAWGLVAYELLAGVHPFAGKTSAAQFMAAQLTQQPTPIQEQVPDISAGLAHVGMRFLQQSADQRAASAAHHTQKLYH